MALIMACDNNLINLPNELIKMIFNKMNDDDLIMQMSVSEFSPFVSELLKDKLGELSMRNLIRLYPYENIRNNVLQSFNQLSSLKYNEIKDIYQRETEQNVRNSIEQFIANYFLEIVGQAVPEGLIFIKQIDVIRAFLLTARFFELVDENGPPFHLFNAVNGTIERKITSININLVNIGMWEHSYQLNISVGFSNKCRISRGSMIEADCECDFNSVFLRLYDSIIQNYNLNEMTINTHTVGNNVIGQLNEEFSI